MINTQTTTHTTPATPAPTNRMAPTVRTATVVTSPPEPARVTPGVPVAVFVLVLVLGGGLRLAALLTDRCLWIDEAMLALNLVSRTPRQLFDPLDWNQGAPVGFLLAVKASIGMFGASEWALRLVPFAASLGGMVGFAWVSRRLLSPGAALFATVLFAFSPYLVSYAGECKQYACDAAVAVGLFSIALGLLTLPSPRWGEGGSEERSDEEPGEGKATRKELLAPHPAAKRGHPLPSGERANAWRWAALAGAGALAVWCSHPAAFVLGGIGTALLAQALVARNRARFLSAALTVGCWLVSFGACYLICLRQLGGNKYLTDYWTDHFMALPPKSFGDLSWIADHLIAFCTTPGGFGGLLVPLGGFAAVLALIGLREFARDRWPVAVALAMPVALVMFASGLHKYPFGGRLLLFLVPFATLAVAAGAWVIFDALRDKNRFAAFAVLGVLAIGSGWQSFEIVRRPLRHEQLAPVIEKVRADMQPGDRVYVYYSAIPAFTFYTRERPLGEASLTFGQEHRGDPAGYITELGKLHGRVWVIFSHPHNYEETVIRTALDCRGTCERDIKLPGAAAWLYRLPGEEPHPPAPFPGRERGEKQ